MKYRIIRLDELMVHDAFRIEAALFKARFDPPRGMNDAAMWRGLESGELLLLAESPQIALLKVGAQGEWLISERAAPLVNEELQVRVLRRVRATHGTCGVGFDAVMRPTRGGRTATDVLQEPYQYPTAVVTPDYQPREAFYYGVLVSCPPATLQRFIGNHFVLAATGKEPEVTLMPRPLRAETCFEATTQTSTLRRLRVMKGGRCYEGLSIADVSQQSHHGVVRERYMAVMPTVQVGQRLAFPTRGYYYHFVSGCLVQEYEISSDSVFTYAFAPTHSSAKRRAEGLQSALLVLDQVHGAVPDEQHLAYCPQRLSENELDTISPEWLQAHALRLDLATLHRAIREGREGTEMANVARNSLPARSPDQINIPANSHYVWRETHLDSSRRYAAICSERILDKHLPLVNVWQAPALMAYVINTIMPYGELGLLPEVVAAMTQGLETNYLERVAIVLGVNGKASDDKAIRTAVAETRGGVRNLEVEVHLVPMTFRGNKFPYGTMRNILMESEATLSLVRRFAEQGWAPYISFQDFDTGSRSLETGTHIFKGIDALLLQDEDGSVLRPLMIAGGYRPQQRDRLITMTTARYPNNIMPAEHQQKLDAFEAAIREDMATRDRYAALDPMLPYAPEPNLFIDGTLLLGEGARPAFSLHGAEYEGLSSSLVACNKAELEAYFTPYFKEAEEIPVPMNRHPTHEPLVLSPDREEIASQLEIASQTNRHPWRGIAFLLDFTMTVETDLSRLAYSYLSQNKLPQQHNLSYLVTRLFQTRGDKKGIKLSDIRTAFDYETAMAAAKEKGSEPVREFLVRHKQELVGMAGARFSDYFAQRFHEQGVFADRHYNLPLSHQSAFTYQVAIEPELTKRRRLNL